MTIRNQYSIIAVTALLIGFAVIFFSRQISHEGKNFIYAVPFKSDWGWGYKIYRGISDEKDTAIDKIYIKQDLIPGIPGKQGFSSEADAMRVAGLVIQKISSNQLPTITARDLDSLGIIKK
jgi:hypothetical protein